MPPSVDIVLLTGTPSEQGSSCVGETEIAWYNLAARILRSGETILERRPGAGQPHPDVRQAGAELGIRKDGRAAPRLDGLVQIHP